jgi:hypothetical protein
MTQKTRIIRQYNDPKKDNQTIQWPKKRIIRQYNDPKKDNQTIQW